MINLRFFFCLKTKFFFPFECYLLEYFQMAGSALRRLIAEYKRKNLNKKQSFENLF